MLRAKVIAGAVIVACALGAGTTVASAAVKAKVIHHPKAVAPAALTFDSAPPASLRCGKGQTYELHTMGKMKWACVKAAA